MEVQKVNSIINLISDQIENLLIKFLEHGFSSIDLPDRIFLIFSNKAKIHMRSFKHYSSGIVIIKQIDYNYFFFF
jgi:hypothetical protein